MPNQFDIYRTNDGATVVIIQADVLDALPTRVVIPLVSSEQLGVGLKRLMPVIIEGDTKLRLLPQQMATVMTSSLVTYIGSAAHLRDDIIRACDMLLAGY